MPEFDLSLSSTEKSVLRTLYAWLYEGRPSFQSAFAKDVGIKPDQARLSKVPALILYGEMEMYDRGSVESCLDLLVGMGLASESDFACNGGWYLPDGRELRSTLCGNKETHSIRVEVRTSDKDVWRLVGARGVTRGVPLCRAFALTEAGVMQARRIIAEESSPKSGHGQTEAARRLHEHHTGAGQPKTEKPLSEPEPNPTDVSSAETKPHQPGCSHSPNFTSVNWFGTRYTFSKGNRAEAVRVLWKAWEEGEHNLSQEEIGDLIESTARHFDLAKTFKQKLHGGGYKTHPAWGTMIQSDSKGCYRLVPPESV